MLRNKRISIQPVAANAAGIAAAQTPGAPGALALVSTPVVLDPPRRVQATTAGNETGKTLLITGLNRWGQEISESLALANIGTTLSRYEYSSISSAVISAAAVANVSLGWTGTFYSPWLPVDRYATGVLGFGVMLQGGTANYDVQHTFRPNLLLEPWDFTTMEDEVFTHELIAAQTTDQDGNYAFPVRAVRLRINSWTSGGPILFDVNPAGS